jgi:uncharacterized metal-binding protein YceD (DUF177 family)
MIAPEFSRPIALDRIGVTEKSFSFDASPEECALLAKRLGIPAVGSLHTTLSVQLIERGRRVRLKGRVQADLTQICVVTLEPIATRVDEEFARQYTALDTRMPAEIVIDMEEDDPPEPILDGQIDMGEAAAEHLALAMDPFPRRPDAVFEAPPEVFHGEPPKVSPFELLALPRKKV